MTDQRPDDYVKQVDGQWHAHFHGERIGTYGTERGAKRAVSNASARHLKFCARMDKVHDELIGCSPKIKAELERMAKEGRDVDSVAFDFVIVTIRRMIGIRELLS